MEVHKVKAKTPGFNPIKPSNVNLQVKVGQHVSSSITNFIYVIKYAIKGPTSSHSLFVAPLINTWIIRSDVAIYMKEEGLGVLLHTFKNM